MFDRGFTVSFPALNYPARTFGFVSTHGALYRRRSNPDFAVPPSSVLFQTEESDNLPELRKNQNLNLASASCGSSASILSQADSVGIIGGVSVGSTLDFVRKLVNWSSKVGENCLPFVLCSDPVLHQELLSHERSSFPSISRKSEVSKMDHKLIVDNLRQKRVFLEKSGARCIVMPCHISHSWHDDISHGCPISFLNMAECVAKELSEMKMKPLEAGSPLRIGVLTTSAILEAGFYQEKLENEGFEVVLPDKATMDHTIVPAIEASNRDDMEGARNLLRIALQVLLVRAVNTVVLASDDLRDILPQDDPLLKKCIDPVDALARSTIKWAKAVERRS